MAIIAGTPGPEGPPHHDVQPPFTARTAATLRALMDNHDLSVRELAALLDVSHMWVQRRARGEVALSDEDTERIRAVLENVPPRSV